MATTTSPPRPRARASSGLPDPPGGTARRAVASAPLRPPPLFDDVRRDLELCAQAIAGRWQPQANSAATIHERLTPRAVPNHGVPIAGMDSGRERVKRLREVSGFGSVPAGRADRSAQPGSARYRVQRPGMEMASSGGPAASIGRVSADGTDPIDAAATRATGSRLRKEGDAEGAIAAFRRVIEARHPDQSPMAAIELGYLFRDRGDFADAEGCFLRAREFAHPDWTPCADVDLGVTLGFANNLPAAIEAFQRAIDSAHPDQTPRAWKELGFQYAEHGFPDRAADAYRRAIASRHPKFAPEAAGYLAELPKPTVEPAGPVHISDLLIPENAAERTCGWQPDPHDAQATRFWDSKRRLITVTDQALALRKDLVRFESITGVAYLVTNVTTTTNRPGTLKRVDRMFLVVDASGTHEIDLGSNARRVGGFLGNQDPGQQAWDGLVKISQQMIEPRLCAGALRTLRGGGAFEVNAIKRSGVVLTADGFEVSNVKGRKREFAWGQLTGSCLDKGWVKAFARVPGQSESELCFSISMKVPNAVLLPTLMSARVRELSS